MTTVTEKQAGGSSSKSVKDTEKVRSTWPIYAMAVVVAGFVGGLIGYSFVGESLVALGIPDPGPVTTLGLPMLRAMSWVLAALAIGSYMFSAFYISPKFTTREKLSQAPLTVDGHIASRTGAVAVLCFALLALVQVPMVMSDTSGAPFIETLSPEMFFSAITQVAISAVWLICAILAFIVGILGLNAKKWGSQPFLFLGAIGMIVPLGMEGHAATGGNHDYGTNAYLWHLVFMAIWIGGLLALIAHGRRLGPELEPAVRRYSAVALFAVLAVALSGVVSSLIRVQPEDLFTTKYGLIIVAKIVATILLALFGFAHRQLTIPKLNKDRWAFVRLAVGEVVLMAATAGIAVTMGRTPPPPPRDPNISEMEIYIGYDLFKEPTFFGVFTVWRFDIMFGVIAILAATAYLLGVRSVKKQGKPWNNSYTGFWIAGCLSLLITTSSGIGLYMPATYSMHMTGHMVLSMVVPLLLAMGGPLTLIMTVWDSGTETDGRPTPHDWAYALSHNKFMEIMSIPWANLLQFLFFFYAMYLSIPFYGFVISEHAGHLIMNWVFIISGYLYFWEMLGPDPVPNHRPAKIRLLWLVISMPIHLFLGVYLMQLNVVMGEEFYQQLNLPWEVDLLADQKVGGGIAWAFGSFPLTFAFIWLMLEWRRDEKDEEELFDARADAAMANAGSTGDMEMAVAGSGKADSGAAGRRLADEDDEPVVDELEAYNEMLARYSQGGHAMQDYHQQEFAPEKKQTKPRKGVRIAKREPKEPDQES